MELFYILLCVILFTQTDATCSIKSHKRGCYNLTVNNKNKCVQFEELINDSTTSIRIDASQFSPKQRALVFSGIYELCFKAINLTSLTIDKVDNLKEILTLLKNQNHDYSSDYSNLTLVEINCTNINLFENEFLDYMNAIFNHKRDFGNSKDLNVICNYAYDTKQYLYRLKAEYITISKLSDNETARRTISVKPRNKLNKKGIK